MFALSSFDRSMVVLISFVIPQLQTELPECAKQYLHHGTASTSCWHAKRSSVEETLVKGKYQQCEGCFVQESPPSCEAGDSKVSTASRPGLTTTCQTVIMPDSTDCGHTVEVASDNRQANAIPFVQAYQSDSVGQLDIPLHERYASSCGTLAEYLELESEEHFTPYLLQEKFFKRVWVMDLVTANVTHSCCFTKRYVWKYSYFIHSIIFRPCETE